MDLNAAIQTIQSSKAEAIRPVMLKPLVGEADHYLLFNPFNGSIEERPARVGPVVGTASSLTGLVQLVSKYREAHPALAVWCGDGEVRAVLKDEDRRNVLVFKLQHSRPFLAINNADEELGDLSQDEMVSLLRTTFADRVADASVLPTIRQMKFSRSSDTERDVQVGRESMGQKIMAEVHAGGRALPELVHVDAEVFANAAEADVSFDYPLVLSVDLANARFTLEPDPDWVRTSVVEAEGRVAAWLRQQLPGVTVLENASPK